MALWSMELSVGVLVVFFFLCIHQLGAFVCFLSLCHCHHSSITKRLPQVQVWWKEKTGIDHQDAIAKEKVAKELFDEK